MQSSYEAEAHLSRGEALLFFKIYQEVSLRIAGIEALLYKLNPNTPSNLEDAAWLIYEGVYTEDSSSEVIIAAIERARELCCVPWHALRILGLTYKKLQNYSKAIEILEETSVHPSVTLEDQMKLYVQIAELYCHLKEFKKARDYLVRAMEIDVIPLNISLSEYEILTKNILKIIPICDFQLCNLEIIASQLKRLQNSNVEIDGYSLYIYASNCQKDPRRKFQAVHFFNAAIARYAPNIAPIAYYIERAKSYTDEKQAEDAIANLTFIVWHLNKTKKLTSELRSELYFDRCSKYILLGDLEKAKQEYAKCDPKQVQRSFIDLLHKRAKKFQHENELDKTASWYQAILDIDPNNLIKLELQKLKEKSVPEEELSIEPKKVKKKKRQTQAPFQFSPNTTSNNQNKELQRVLEEQKKVEEAAAAEQIKERSQARKLAAKRKKKRQKERATSAITQPENLKIEGCENPSSPALIQQEEEARPPELCIPLSTVISELLVKLKYAWLVGGSVRDWIINPDSEIEDNDIVARLEQPFIPVEFKQNQFEKNLYQWGNIDLWLSDSILDDNFLYLDSRKRDFTINALYANKKGFIEDPSGRGLDDIKNKVINTILPAQESFKNDPIRMLRAIYFATKLNFELHKDVIDAIELNSQLLLQSANAGKVCFWLRKLLAGDKAAENFSLLIKHGVLAKMFPQFAEKMNRHALEITDTIKQVCLENKINKRFNNPNTIMSYLCFSSRPEKFSIEKAVSDNPILDTFRKNSPGFYCLLLTSCSHELFKQKVAPLIYSQGNPYGLMAPPKQVAHTDSQQIYVGEIKI